MAMHILIESSILTNWIEISEIIIGYHKAQENYEGIDAMVSMRSDFKIEWLQELGPIVKQGLDVSDGTL